VRLLLPEFEGERRALESFGVSLGETDLFFRSCLQLHDQEGYVQALRDVQEPSAKCAFSPLVNSTIPDFLLILLLSSPSFTRPALPLLTAIEQPPFEVTETGWGEFDVTIKVFFVAESNEKPLTFTHHLKLHPWPVDPILYHQPTLPGEPPNPALTGHPAPVLSPVHSWQYEEIVFTEPTESFYATLLENKPSPLPRTNRHPRLLTHPLSGGGNVGEFTTEMEDEEGARLDKAKVKTLDQIEELRQLLVQHEQELGGAFLPFPFPFLSFSSPSPIRSDSLFFCQV
jgi:transcription initiation factor IIF auxiliary subunit